MKKPYRYDEMSNEKCDRKSCAKHLKKNVVSRVRRRPLVCYEHYTEDASARQAASQRRRGKS